MCDLLCRMKVRGIVPAVSITDAALTAITREAPRSLDGLETGGILLGTDTADGVLIRHAGDAGPSAARGERTFLRDLDHARQFAESAWVEDGSQWIGEWHTHPTGELAPSDVDLNSYMRHLHDPDLGFDQFVAIIAGLDSSSRIIVSTWLIERNRFRPVPLMRLLDDSPEQRNTTIEATTEINAKPYDREETL
ncbi:Mov34/MPN/PAD-1 family protein [Agromyces sp. G08B096]|uniref:Mov34/MPN/PAD-1 family protein n=1 Tax=Agromyces sp. G08B096 TaxID=3156399 RepID=A0AAU7WBH3_9MICO